MASSVAATSHIIKREQLLSDENIETIVQAYFQDKSLKVTGVERGHDNDLEGVNNNFMSELEKWTIKVEDNNGTIQELGVILKSSLTSSLQKFMDKMNLSFLREVFWYTEALPAFKGQMPTTLSPIAYHGYTKYNREGVW